MCLCCNSPSLPKTTAPLSRQMSWSVSGPRWQLAQKKSEAHLKPNYLTEAPTQTSHQTCDEHRSPADMSPNASSPVITTTEAALTKKKHNRGEAMIAGGAVPLRTPAKTRKGRGGKRSPSQSNQRRGNYHSARTGKGREHLGSTPVCSRTGGTMQKPVSSSCSSIHTCWASAVGEGPKSSARPIDDLRTLILRNARQHHLQPSK